MPSVVVRVEKTSERGMHAPLTKDSSIIVDGILASSYAKSASLTWGPKETLVTGHTLNVFMHAPLRFACEASPSLCGPEWHIAESGRHSFTQWILDTFPYLQYANRAHSDLQAALFGEDATISSWIAVAIQVAATVALAALYYGIFAWHPLQALAAAAIVVAATLKVATSTINEKAGKREKKAKAE